MTIAGIGGSIEAKQVGDLKGFEEVYFHPSSVANILSYYDMAQKYDIEYDKNNNVFKVKLNDNQIWVFEPKNKLYVFNPLKNSSKDNGKALITTSRKDKNMIVETVKNNIAGYTRDEVKRANIAKELWKIMAYPSIKDFVWWMIKNGKLIGTDVTVHDVHRMLRIYGPDWLYCQETTGKSCD
jgi:hypothetical protein